MATTGMRSPPTPGTNSFSAHSSTMIVVPRHSPNEHFSSFFWRHSSGVTTSIVTRRRRHRRRVYKIDANKRTNEHSKLVQIAVNEATPALSPHVSNLRSRRACAITLTDGRVARTTIRRPHTATPRNVENRGRTCVLLSDGKIFYSRDLGAEEKINKSMIMKELYSI